MLHRFRVLAYQIMSSFQHCTGSLMGGLVPFLKCTGMESQKPHLTFTAAHFSVPLLKLRKLNSKPRVNLTHSCAAEIQGKDESVLHIHIMNRQI